MAVPADPVYQNDTVSFRQAATGSICQNHEKESAPNGWIKENLTIYSWKSEYQMVWLGVKKTEDTGVKKKEIENEHLMYGSDIYAEIE